jgi:hypothetical protein
MNPGKLKLVRDLNDPHHNLMRVTILVQQIELYHWVVPVHVAFYVSDLIALKMFLNFLLKNKQGVGKIYFDGTGVVGWGLHKLF